MIAVPGRAAGSGDMPDAALMRKQPVAALAGKI
jgi:hypothetical protein